MFVPFATALDVATASSAPVSSGGASHRVWSAPVSFSFAGGGTHDEVGVDVFFHVSFVCKLAPFHVRHGRSFVAQPRLHLFHLLGRSFHFALHGASQLRRTRRCGQPFASFPSHGRANVSCAPCSARIRADAAARLSCTCTCGRRHLARVRRPRNGRASCASTRACGTRTSRI